MIPGKFPHLAVAPAGGDGVGSPSTRTRRGRCVSTSAVAAPNAFGADRGKSVVTISRRGRGQQPRLQYQSRLHQSQITSHRSFWSHGLGLGCGVGRTLGIGLPLGVGEGRGVEVAVAVGVGVGVAHGVSVYVRDWFCGGESGQQMQKSSV